MTQTPEDSFLPIDPGAAICFSCHAERSCFNHCCHDISQVLYPYDILRLKNHLALSSSAFLATYCTVSDGESTALPVVTFKLDAGHDWACPFVNDEGCRVYPDRPASCRIFPFARGLVRDRATGRITEHYARIPDPQCQGFTEPHSLPFAQWLGGQELATYNEMNDAMMPLISLKNRLRPGPLEPWEKEIFITGCYDLDGFRDGAFRSGQLVDLFPEERLLAAEKHEEKLLLLALEWVRFRLFGKSR
ncbi:YkgJ family cysteine cluster protein [Desulfobotulus sp.]|jgi:Fe-S-cluster containining protein|uniref:YkgJ family cysteine cluster protein n=1 Tax=Desulfobotulus sp. TaxID=1940337 RepID=UPI002A369155|nr:YkgJ family cysteine cluster protein [Desulfobotulus sp.]MDY0163688.1 YkgJ family cysteine cluster protein [Desulfobotulus sp.]